VIKLEDQEKKEMIDIIRQALKPESEFSLANKPFAGEEKEESEKFILKPNESKQIDKKLEIFTTGTFIDSLFLNGKGEQIGGVPFGIQLGIAGLPDVGKSILVQEIALNVCKDRKVLYITSEDVWHTDTARFDLESRMKEKADFIYEKVIPADERHISKEEFWDLIKENLFVMDTITYSELNDWFTFVQAYKHCIEKEKIDLVIIDSVTLLDNYRGALKYRLMELAKFNQLNGVTAIFINQRSSDDWDTYKMAGGIGIPHGLDSTLIVDYGKAWNSLVKRDLDVKQGTFVRIARLTGCRISGFMGNYIEVAITKEGFLRVVVKPDA